MAKRIIPLYVGERFGRLTILAPAERRNNNLAWLCLCECGMQRCFSQSDLRSGRTQSCGCRHREIVSSHGRSNTTEWRAWRDMLGRCRTPSHPSFGDYGGRGITVCAEWHNFDRFFADLGLRPTNGMSLERLNNARGYEPGNVIWATKEQQVNNTRQNRRIVLFGESMTIAQAARRHGLKWTTLRGRLDNGLSPEAAIVPRLPIGRPRIQR